MQLEYFIFRLFLVFILRWFNLNNILLLLDYLIIENLGVFCSSIWILIFIFFWLLLPVTFILSFIFILIVISIIILSFVWLIPLVFLSFLIIIFLLLGRFMLRLFNFHLIIIWFLLIFLKTWEIILYSMLIFSMLYALFHIFFIITFQVFFVTKLFFSILKTLKFWWLLAFLIWIFFLHQNTSLSSLSKLFEPIHFFLFVFKCFQNIMSFVGVFLTLVISQLHIPLSTLTYFSVKYSSKFFCHLFSVCSSTLQWVLVILLAVLFWLFTQCLHTFFIFTFLVIAFNHFSILLLQLILDIYLHINLVLSLSFQPFFIFKLFFFLLYLNQSILLFFQFLIFFVLIVLKHLSAFKIFNWHLSFFIISFFVFF